MIKMVSTKLLKPNPNNTEYFSDLPADKYDEIRRSIQFHGIRDPLKVLSDNTVIAGHIRLKIAQELGIDKVPVTVLDLSYEEAEYLLIADNQERRQQDDDPVKKAKRAKFLAKYWGVRLGKGGRQKCNQNGEIRTAKDVADAAGLDAAHLSRLIKLNDLIPPIQSLVSQGRLSQTAAGSLAFLSPKNQEELLRVLGESGVCGLSVNEARELRRELELTNNRKKELADKLKSAKSELQSEREHNLVANAEIKGNAIPRKVKLRSSITMAARVIGEAVARVKIDDYPELINDQEAIDRIHALVRLMRSAADELESLTPQSVSNKKTVIAKVVNKPSAKKSSANHKEYLQTSIFDC